MVLVIGGDDRMARVWLCKRLEVMLVIEGDDRMAPSPGLIVGL
jgi:hypothetical protein